MEPSVKRVEELIGEKVLVFRELADLLKEEGGSLRNIDVEALWAFSAKKEAAAARIASIRNEITGIMDLIRPDHGMAAAAFSLERVIDLLPKEAGRRLSNVSVTARLLKEEVTATARANTRFVRESLGVIDGMITTMTGEEEKAQGYDRNAAAPSAAPSAASGASSGGAATSPGKSGIAAYGNGAASRGNHGTAYGGSASSYGGTGAGTSRMFNTRA